MEEMWKLRAEQFDGPFSQDQAQLLDDESEPLSWKETIGQFCQNVHQHEHHPDFSSDDNNPSHTASQSVTAALDEMVSALEEINQQQFGGTV